CSGIYGGCKDLNEHLQKTLAERLTQHENEKKSKSIKM
ncbi:DNA primase, partial [Phocaeicola vulgatus]